MLNEFNTVLPNSLYKLAASAMVVGAALVALLMPMRHADAALIDRVNEAIRAAGAPTTVERSDAFQKGVYVGHYTSYDQLVGAIIFHKDNDALPVFADPDPTASNQCIKGDLDSFSAVRIDITGDVKGTLVTKSLHIASNQYNIAIERGIGTGSNVKACTSDDFQNLYGHLTLN